MTAPSDMGAFLRTKLRSYGVTDDTDLPVLCDAIVTVLSEGAPGEQLEKLRRQIDRAAWRVKPPDRQTWGLLPGQAEQAARLAGTS